MERGRPITLVRISSLLTYLCLQYTVFYNVPRAGGVQNQVKEKANDGRQLSVAEHPGACRAVNPSVVSRCGGGSDLRS